MVGTGIGAKNGILIKNTEALEKAHKLTTIILDKTGTITEGKPSVNDVITTGWITENKLIQLAASAENKSEHPLAETIVKFANEKGIALLAAEDFSAKPGRGIEAIVENKKVLIGNEKLMAENKIPLKELKDEAIKSSKQAKSPMFVSIDGKLAGIIAVSDKIKKESRAAIEKMKKNNLDVLMITGDNKITAKVIAEEAGINETIAGVSPQEKASKIKELQGLGRITAMVGDGINDAVALAQSDIGIAIGTGTDVAAESADIVLMKSTLDDVNTAIKLSRNTIRNIKQNLFWAFGYNILLIPVAAGVLHIFGGPLMNPVFAAAAMSLSSLSVISNALRLKFFKP